MTNSKKANTEVVENQEVKSEEKQETKSTKKWQDLPKDERFSKTWKDVMQRITTAYVFNKTAQCYPIKTDFLHKDETLEVLSVMSFKGLISDFDVKFGRVAYDKKLKNGKTEKAYFVNIKKLYVYGVNPRANNDKYVGSFNYAQRLMQMFGIGGTTPVSDMNYNPDINRFGEQKDIEGNIVDRTYEEHIKDEFVKTNVEYLDSEDSSTKELNKQIMSELAK